MDLICFSHLRWDFVYQRPQHLMSRFAKQNRVFFIEEPVFDTENNHLQLELREGLTVVIPHLQAEGSGEDHALQQVNLLKELFNEENITDYFFWYYTPMALALGNSFSPQLIVCLLYTSDAADE